MLKIAGVSKRYQQGSESVEVIRRLDFELLAGQRLAIVGQSGSGKSTLLTLIAGLDRPSEGDILFQGQSYRALSEEDLNRFRAAHFGIVFQQFHLISTTTALENVMLPLEIQGRGSDARLKATQLLEEVGLGHRLHHRPAELSGGECQRVAIARALIIEPEVLLADEPSGNLDEATGKKVMDLLFDLVEKKNRSLLLVTHNMDLAARCQRRYRMHDGRLEAVPESRTS